ncbi:fam-a protein [Plasmodium vinckei lentum]|uniref:Fam-a protein n=1 Tax=Plasmodium vinckei lentum TaxID=138297 RepID=A0A6V7SF70_PLAVN|nr:fam-a protein [Plasmodium vinckei lentum]
MNKFYIQIVFFLLSVSVYLNNKTLATEPAPTKIPQRAPPKPPQNAPNKSATSEPTNRFLTSEKIYEKNKQLLCTDSEETKQAIKLMNEAVKHLENHATSQNDYKRVGGDPYHYLIFYEKEHKEHTKVGKFQYIIHDPNKYNETIDELWDPDCINLLDHTFTKRKITRVYSPNIIMIQQRYRKWRFGRQKYFYALATKVEISKDKTIIAMTSANINDHNPSKNEYKNTIVESANSFKTDIDSEDDIRQGKLKKMFVNIAGYLIEKKDKCVDITYVRSIDEHGSN